MCHILRVRVSEAGVVVESCEAVSRMDYGLMPLEMPGPESEKSRLGASRTWAEKVIERGERMLRIRACLRVWWLIVLFQSTVRGIGWHSSGRGVPSEEFSQCSQKRAGVHWGPRVGG